MKQLSKRKPLHRITALLLSMVMLLSLMPTSAWAAAGDAYYPSSSNSHSTDGDVSEDFSGFLIRYNAPNTGDNNNGNDVIRIDFGFHKQVGASEYDFQFHYDPAVVTLANYKSGTIATIVPDEFDGVSAADKRAAIVPKLLPESVVKEGSTQKNNIINSYAFPNSASGLAAENGATARHIMEEPDVTLMNFGEQDDGSGGYLPTLSGTLYFHLSASCKPNFATHNLMISATEENVLSTTNVTGPVYVASVYFKVADISKVNDKTFYGVAAVNSPTGMDAVINGNHYTDTNFIGFPEPPPAMGKVTVTVKNSDGAYPNNGSDVGLLLTKNGAGRAVQESFTEEDATYDKGVYTFENVPIGTYTLAASGTGVGFSDDKTYNVDYTNTNLVVQDSTDGTVSADTVSTSDIKVVNNTYKFRIKAVNSAGEVQDLSKATVKFANTAVTPAAAADNAYEITVSASGTQSLSISGLPGYKDTTASLVLSTQGLTTVTGITSTDATVTGSNGDFLVTVTVPMETTNITMPLPIPDDVTEDIAGGMTITLKPVDGSSEELKNEVGSGGIKTGASDIKVTTDPETGKVTGIEVSADLPDGSYEVTIGGAGVEDVKTTITVVTIYDDDGNVIDRVVNIGGNATLENGEVTKIEGGVTASGDSAAAGSGKVDLTNPSTPLKKGDTTIGAGGATITGPGGSGNAEEVTGGLTSDNISSETGVQKPAVVSDPLYMVKVKDPTVSNGVAQSFEVEVYLKNLRDVVSGSFGMYFDPTIFNVSKGQSIVTLADTELLEFNSAMLGFNDTYSNPEVQSNYVVFYWSIKDADKAPLDAISETKIATITLPVKSDASVGLLTNLQKLVDDRTIYTMDFALTDTGSLPEVSNEWVMPAAWRPVNMAGINESSMLLSADKATRGGFYQASAYGYESYNEDKTPVEDTKTTVNYDVRMQFQLPDIMKQNHRADFWVTEQDKTGIDGATITIYDKDPATATETDSATALATLTTKNGGYAYTNLKPGTYWYSIKEDGHWAYPTGKAGSDGTKYDQFTLTEDGISATAKEITNEDNTKQTKFYLDGSTVNTDGTEVVRDYINPVMDPTTYHEVALEKEAETEQLHVSITSPTKAYNSVNYYFTLQPEAGYEWNITDTQTMADLLGTNGKLSATIYNVTAGTPDPNYRAEPYTAVDIHWDASKEQFCINGEDIKGDPLVGDLRAGDLVLVAKKDIVKKAQYTVTATAGIGGTVEYKDAGTNSSLDITGTDDSSVTPGAENTAYQKIIEELEEGETTSATFTFKPLDGYTISKVVINGVEQTITEQQKTSKYTYQFANISSDQSIYVTFLNPDGDEVSNPYVSVKVGANGTMDVQGKLSGADAQPQDSLKGPAAKDYVIDTSVADSLELKIQANGPYRDSGAGGKQYEIDTVLVDNVPLTAEEMASALDKYPNTDDGKTGYVKPLVIPADKLGLGTGVTHSVVVTFKPLGEASTHAIVIARVADGFGNLAPVGTEIYPMGSTPTYTMMPADEDWTVKTGPNATGAVILDKDTDDEVDKSKDVKQSTSDGTATGTLINKFTYQMPALDKTMTTLDVVFSEVAYQVEGLIKTSALKDGGTDVAAATLTFVRAAQGDKDETTITVTSETTLSSDSNKLLAFHADIPEGTWKVTVHKQGYLDYIIDGFEVVKKNDSGALTKHIHFGAADCDPTEATETCGKAARPIPLTIGDAAGDGKAIAFNDASMVTSGWLASALPRNVLKGDVDESRYDSNTGAAAVGAKSESTDMTKVKQNMYKKRVSTDYTTFSTATEADIPVSKP